jgi:hypothetical protein
MKSEWKVFIGTILIGVLLSTSIATVGQQKQAKPDRGYRDWPDGPPPPPPPGDNFVFMASDFVFDGQPVKGAPYSAQAVNESTQELSDGNRIVNKSTSSIYRDSEGRTRREQTLRSFGPFAAGGDAPQLITIIDTVAGVSYTLDPRTHIARKMPAFRFEFKTAAPGVQKAPEGAGVVVVQERRTMPPPGVPKDAPPPDVFTLRAPEGAGVAGEFVFKREGDRNERAVTEKLGTQQIEGVMAEGSRTTTTIPAGEIGNERAIEIVSERWYSPELKTVVMSRHSDPRFGETTYRLTNISRDEPAHTLFEVPADYTLKDDPGPMLRKKFAPPGQ